MEVLRKYLIYWLCKNNQTAQVSNEVNRGSKKSRNLELNEIRLNWDNQDDFMFNIDQKDSKPNSTRTEVLDIEQLLSNITLLLGLEHA